MKSVKCIECGNETHDKDRICALCRKEITKMYDDLLDSLLNDKKWFTKRKKIKLWERDKSLAVTSTK